MDNLVLLALTGLVSSWALAAYAIWKWGPGIRERSVRCPTRKLRAKVLAEQREGEFGCLRVVDVKACSLETAARLTCGKECMVRL